MLDLFRSVLQSARNERGRPAGSGRLIALWGLGSLALLSVSVAAAAIGFTMPTAICVLLIVIALLSLLDSFLSSAILSVVAVGCLNYFFVEPLHTYVVNAPQDILVLVTFLASSLVISTLTQRIRNLRKEQISQAYQIDLARYLTEAQTLSHTGSFGWDPEAGRMVWSDETFRIFDVERSVAPSREVVLQRTHPDDRELVIDTFERAATSSQSIDIEHRLLLPDGTIRHLHVVANASANNGGSVRYVGAVRDVTAQKTIYADLKRSEQRYKQLFDLVPIALWQLDATTLRELFTGLRKAGVVDLQRYLEENPHFLYTCMSALIYQEANERAVRLFGGRDANDFIGRPVGRGWKERPDTFQRAIISRFNGETTFEEETKMSTLDGRIVDVIFTTARLGQTGETTTSVIGAIDITERVRAREQLQQLQAELAHASRVSMLGELTASIAHEVNQPLGAIAATGAACLRWIAHPSPNLDGIRLRIERMMEDARRAAAIIARVRAMATNSPPQRQLATLDDIIRDALLFLRHEIASRSTSVDHTTECAARPLYCDRTQLQQLIVNLCVNAIQAMEHSASERRNVAIRTTARDPDTVCCTVEDSGPGIGSGDIGQIFDSFYTTKDSGMGMGLAICRTIVTAHGGSITVDNNSALGGARFIVTLPAAQSQTVSA